jgi:hypothetical protein
VNQQQPVATTETPLKTYLVNLQVREIYQAHIKASSSEEARRKALAIVDETGTERFDMESGLLDVFVSELG